MNPTIQGWLRMLASMLGSAARRSRRGRRSAFVRELALLDRKQH